MNQNKFISFADPDHEPGAYEREATARAQAAGRHFNANEALLKDVAPHFKATTRTWDKGHSSWNMETWVELKFPAITTSKGTVLKPRIGHDPFREGRYVLSVAPNHLRAEKSFITSEDEAKKLKTALLHDWQKATGVKLMGIEVRIPLDSHSKDMYHRSVEISIGAPSEEVPTAKYIKGVESILETLEMYL